MQQQQINWRPYQIKCKQAIKENFQAGITEQLIVQATGTGKRLAAVDLIQHFSKGKTLFICHREELIMQAYNEIDSTYPMEVGIIKYPVFELGKKVVVASVQTLYNRLDKIPPNEFELLIVDEGHHYVSRTYLETLRHFKPRLTTIWTATPQRLDGLSLSNIAQKIVFQYKIEDGIDEGYLCPLTAYQINTPVDIAQVKKTAGDFNQKELSVKIDTKERNELIVKKYLQYANNRQCIAYCVDIDHAYHLRDIFRDNNVPCETVVSDQERCPNRTEIVREFSKGNIQVLTNVNILTEGFDYSDIGCICMCRPTQSETLYIQSIGRGTRLKSEKFREIFHEGDCIILDFVDNSGKHKLINAYELEKDKPIENRKFLPSEYKAKLLEEREKRERKMITKVGIDKRINLLHLPELLPWNSDKARDPATEKQIKWIKELGLWEEGVEYTKWHASELISNQRARQYQVHYLATMGYDVSGVVTFGQYQRVKQNYERKNKYQMNYE